MDLGGVAVLIVEDNPYIRDLFTITLELCGARPHSAASVHEALELCNKVTPTLILSDIAMPDGDGYELLSALRSHPECRDVPVIAVTGTPDHRDRAFAAGFSEFLVKPLEPRKLCEAVAQYSGQTSRRIPPRVMPAPHCAWCDRPIEYEERYELPGVIYHPACHRQRVATMGYDPDITLPLQHRDRQEDPQDEDIRGDDQATG